MLVVGIGFLLWAALVQFFGLDPVKSGWVVGVVMVLLGLLLGERPWVRR